MRAFPCSALASLVLATLALTAAAAAQPAQTTAKEDIFILRTERSGRADGATPECAAAPFPIRQMDVYDLYSVRTDLETGLVTDPRAQQVRAFTACLGEFAQDGSFQMYSITEIDGRPYTGLNRCEILAANDPAPDSFLLHCHGRVQDSPEGYVGGLLTSSTLAPLGEAPDVPGYTTTSIITMRLWRAQ